MNIEKIVGRLLLLDQIDRTEAITLLTGYVEGKECSDSDFGSSDECCGECGESPCNDDCTCECCYEYRNITNKCTNVEQENLVHDMGCEENMENEILDSEELPFCGCTLCEYIRSRRKTGKK